MKVSLILFSFFSFQDNAQRQWLRCNIFKNNRLIAATMHHKRYQGSTARKTRCCNDATLVIVSGELNRDVYLQLQQLRRSFE